MTPQQLQELIIKQRSQWLELEPEKDGKPAKSVLVQRPAELQVRSDLMKFDSSGNLTGVEVELPHVKQYVTDWKGFHESDLVGGAGSSDPVPFAPGLWAEVIADNAQWHQTVATKIVSLISEHFAKVAEQRKN